MKVDRVHGWPVDSFLLGEPSHFALELGGIAFSMGWIDTCN